MRRLLRMLFLCLIAVVSTLLLLAGCMIAQQDKMIYLPQTYTKADEQRFEQAGLTALEFKTSQGSQTAYWKPSQTASKDAPVWLVFSGNGGCATDYEDVALAGPQRCAWLFVDYPSYGKCEGKPNPKTIRETALGAIDALAKHLKESPETLKTRMGAFGHSIGAAVALDTAAEAGLQRVLVVSPFTSMKDMAARYVSPLLSGFVRHRFDNRSAIDRVVENGAQVIVLHGANDGMIPSSMGKELAERHPESVRFVLVPDAGHNDVINIGMASIKEAIEILAP